MGNMTQNWVNMLIPYTNDYSARYSGTELAKLSKIPQQSTSRYLKAIVEDNLIQFSRQGRNKLFYFDIEKTQTRIILNMLELQKSLNFRDKMQKAFLVVSELLKIVKTVIVYGSYSDCSNKPDSDLDIVIIGLFDEKKLDEIRKRSVISLHFQKVSGKELARLIKGKNPLAIEIMKNHTIFGNVTEMVDIFIDNS